jgi:hypothetical protein
LSGIFKISEMFRKPCTESTNCLPCILHFAIWTRKLIYTVAVDLTFLGVRFLWK